MMARVGGASLRQLFRSARTLYSHHRNTQFAEAGASAPLPWDRRASWSITCCWKDLKLVKPKDHAELSQRATELKRMLTALLQKLTADR
jgi:hypothetical protein